MSTTTSHLGLTVDSSSDAFSPTQIANNWETLDSFPGIYTATTSQVASETATWGSAQTGMIVQETDGLSLQWRWNGSQLVRTYGLGCLSSVQYLAGGFAMTGTGQTILTTTVNIPAGGRTIEIKAQVPMYYSQTTGALWAFEITQDGTGIMDTDFAIDLPNYSGPPVFLYTTVTPSAGSHTYNLVGYTTGALAAVTGQSFQPITLSVVEP